MKKKIIIICSAVVLAVAIIVSAFVIDNHLYATKHETDGLYVFVKEEYKEQFLAKEFTIEDFNSDNLQCIDYTNWSDSRNSGAIYVGLKKTGKWQTEKAKRQFKKLDFVSEVSFIALPPEEDAIDMIELIQWGYPALSSFLPNGIKIIHENDDLDVVFTTDNGEFWGIMAKQIIYQTNKPVYWYDYDHDLDEFADKAIIKILIKDGDSVIGYALIEVNEIDDTFRYSANIIKSVRFSKIDGEYQTISEEHINKVLEKAKAK